jgi:uncharacterized protein YaeQ
VENLTVWQIPADQSQALGALADRSMTLQFTLQEGSLWVEQDGRSVEIKLVQLFGGTR